MGANIFSLRLEKGTLKQILEQIEHQERLYPGHAYGWEYTIDLIPDGIGYEVRFMTQKIVSEEETTCLSHVVVGDDQHNLN
jgi:hypothetical protein